MNRSEVITGIQALRYELEKANFSDNTIDYYDEVLQQCRLAVLLNEQNAPHSRY